MARQKTMDPADINPSRKPTGPVPRDTGKKPSTERRPKHVTPSAQGSQGLSRHSEHFHLANYMG